jgi:hypothetical protein
MKKKLIELFKKIFDIDNPRFKMVILCIVILYIIGVVKFALLYFKTTDTIPKIQPINTETIKKLGAFTAKVKTGFLLKQFPSFNLTGNLFMIDAIIWFEFNSDEIMIDTIEKFSFDQGSIKFKTPPDIKIIDNKILAKYNVLFELKTDLQFHKFPFEDHRLPIIVSNNFVTPEEMYYVVDGSSFQLLPDIFPANWKVVDTNVDAGYINLPLDKQDATKKTANPKALFIINFAKNSIKQIMVIFIPLFSAACFSLLSFITKITNTVGRFTLAVSGVTALLGYRFVIEQIMPKVGYFTTTDEIYIFLLLFSFICFLFQLMFTRHDHLKPVKTPPDAKPQEPAPDEDDPIKLERFNSIFFLLMSLILVIGVTYIILK